MVVCYIALGGNVGDVVTTMDHALERLDRTPGIGVGRVSRVYATQPVGDVAGQAFLNAAACLNVELSPDQLLGRFHATEKELGRARSGRWTPRTIDLDLILYGREVIDRPELCVPHPACWYRRFVLDPLAEIGGDVIHPTLQQSLSQLHQRLCIRPLTVAVIGGSGDDRREAVSCAREFAAVGVWDDVRRIDDLTAEPGLVLSLERTHDEGRRSCQLRTPFMSAPSEAGSFGYDLRERDSAISLKRVVQFSELPGDVASRVRAVLTAALDEPIPHSRPLRRMP